MADDFFLDDPIQDKLLKISMRIAQELYVTHDRVKVLEYMLRQKGLLTDIDEKVAMEALTSTGSGPDDKYAFVNRILSPIVEDIEKSRERGD